MNSVLLEGSALTSGVSATLLGGFGLETSGDVNSICLVLGNFFPASQAAQKPDEAGDRKQYNMGRF